MWCKYYDIYHTIFILRDVSVPSFEALVGALSPNYLLSKVEDHINRDIGPSMVWALLSTKVHQHIIFAVSYHGQQ